MNIFEEIDRMYDNNEVITDIPKPYGVFCNCVFKDNTLLRTPSNIKHLTLPPFINNIGMFAFKYYSGIICLNKAETIQTNAFYCCNAIVYASEVTEIQPEAFAESNILLYAPKLQNIVKDAFVDCSAYVSSDRIRKDNRNTHVVFDPVTLACIENRMRKKIT